MSQTESDRMKWNWKEVNEAVHVYHVHEKCCTVKKEMKFVTVISARGDTGISRRGLTGTSRCDITASHGVLCWLCTWTIRGVP